MVASLLALSFPPREIKRERISSRPPKLVPNGLYLNPKAILKRLRLPGGAAFFLRPVIETSLPSQVHFPAAGRSPQSQLDPSPSLSSCLEGKLSGRSQRRVSFIFGADEGEGGWRVPLPAVGGACGRPCTKESSLTRDSRAGRIGERALRGAVLPKFLASHCLRAPPLLLRELRVLLAVCYHPTSKENSQALSDQETREGKFMYRLRAGGVCLDGMAAEERVLALENRIDEERSLPRFTQEGKGRFAPFAINRNQLIVSMLCYDSNVSQLDQQCGVPRSKRVLNPEGEGSFRFSLGSILVLTKPNQLHRFSVSSGRHISSVTLDASISFV